MRPRARQSGFAMLLVFAMAAAVGILLYMELPRVAFEAQRQREQLLIDRGEQYQRAIQLYFRKTRQFPANLEQLENTNNHRFLRRRYKDPMTGKDEWRLIHIGPGGMLTDSLTQKPPGLKTDKEKKEKAEAAGEGGKAEQPAVATRRRASEMAGPGLLGSVPPGAVMEPGAQPGQEGQPAWPSTAGIYPQPAQVYPPQAYPPPSTGEPQVGEPYVAVGQQTVPPGPQSYPAPGVPPVEILPGTQTPGQVFPVIQPGQSYPGGQPSGQVYPGAQPGQTYPVVQPGQVYPGAQSWPMYPGMQQAGQVNPVIPPGQVYPGASPGQTFPGMQPSTPYPQGSLATPPGAVRIYPSGAGSVPPGFLQNLLTGGGQPGVSPQGGGQQTSPSAQYQPPREPPTGTGVSNPALEMIRKILTTPRPGGLGQAQPQQTFTFGAGIAGVASKAEADSIIIYNDRSRYNEWEFIYDLRKDRTMVGPLGPGGAPAGKMLEPSAGSSSTITPMSPMTPTLPTGQGGRGR